MMEPRIWILATLDTKQEPVQRLVEGIVKRGGLPTVVDISARPSTATLHDSIPLVPSSEVASAAGVDPTSMAAMDRGNAVKQMSVGAKRVLHAASKRGEVGGVIGIGGSAGATISANAMRQLPLEIPKVLVSTVVSGDTRKYVGISDMVLIFPIVDLVGMNFLLAGMLDRAAGILMEMARSGWVHPRRGKTCGITAFGATTECVETCRRLLAEKRFEVLAFHARGTGGEAMESLVASGALDTVLDVTTTELADEVAGGIYPSSNRLSAAPKRGIPNVVIPGALDIVNLGSPDRQDAERLYPGRILYQHNPNSLLMRTSGREMETIGRLMAQRLNRHPDRVAVLIPRLGFSAYDREGEIFHDPEADSAFARALVSDIDPGVEVSEFDLHINDPEFARIAVDKVAQLEERE